MKQWIMGSLRIVSEFEWGEAGKKETVYTATIGPDDLMVYTTDLDQFMDWIRETIVETCREKGIKP
jgi:hypothetical protein